MKNLTFYLQQTVTCSFFLLLTPGLLADDHLQIAKSQKKWFKVYEKQENIPKPSEMLINSEPEPELNNGFKSLIHAGLEGWTPRGGECKFEYREGTIIGTVVDGSPSTYLCTDQVDFEDFIFTAELKHEVDGNTGVMFRASVKPSKNGQETVFGPQCEVEAYTKKRFWSGGIYGQSAGGWIYPMWLESHSQARDAMNPKGEWNRITIQARGDTIKTWLNGVPAAHWKTTEYTSGFFGLQIHKGKSGTIHFRNVKVREL